MRYISMFLYHAKLVMQWANKRSLFLFNFTFNKYDVFRYDVGAKFVQYPYLKLYRCNESFLFASGC